GSIARELVETFEHKLAGTELTVEDVRIGVFYTAVKLSDGHAGVAFTPRDQADTVCCPRSAGRMPASGKLKGSSVWKLLPYATSDNSLQRAVGIAIVNALSARLMETGPAPGAGVIMGADALDAVSFRPEDRVVLVGAFTPFIRKLRPLVQELLIIDRHPQALKPEEMAMWRAPERASEVLPLASVAVITGSAMVEGGLEELLSFCHQTREVVLAGPTASMWPEPLFRRGVTALGGITVRDADRLLQVVGEGGSGYFFAGPARKMAIVRDR
ncbi:MAG: DUF364 domain-containing protein, partial [Dehalococcoidia bacterium]|nr:DUF364 domain-containing protein [Dehalococcoidia bacterium]